MSDWSPLMDRDWSMNDQYYPYTFYDEVYQPSVCYDPVPYRQALSCLSQPELPLFSSPMDLPQFESHALMTLAHSPPQYPMIASPLQMPLIGVPDEAMHDTVMPLANNLEESDFLTSLIQIPLESSPMQHDLLESSSQMPLPPSSLNLDEIDPSLPLVNSSEPLVLASPDPLITPSLPTPSSLNDSPRPSFNNCSAKNSPKNDNFVLKGDSPRELRNKAEKQRRDTLNQSVSELASIVPSVLAASRKIDKTGVLRLTAHYLRAHQHIFGDSIGKETMSGFNSGAVETLLRLLNGFLLTCTFKGIIVVVSQNIKKYLGYNELDLLGQNIFNIVHEDDHHILNQQLTPISSLIGPNNELIVPDDPEGKQKLKKSLSNEKRRFIVRFKKCNQKSEPVRFLTCHVEGSLRMSDRAGKGTNRSRPAMRRARARSDNPCSSGNDVVFIGLVRPSVDTFQSESEMECFKMEYRTRHAVDGQIVYCEQKISLVTGYMTDEIQGVNAMNFMHRDDVRWVVVALREMYDEHRLFGESSYRLIMKNGQFVYMRTQGYLEVNHNTRAVTSFVCSNSVVGEDEGKQLIRKMKKKLKLSLKNNEDVPEDDNYDVNDNSPLLEDPKKIKVLVSRLVKTIEKNKKSISSNNKNRPFRWTLNPPDKQSIEKSIKKIYKVINIPEYFACSCKSKKMAEKPKKKETKKNAIDSSRNSPRKVKMLQKKLEGTPITSKDEVPPPVLHITTLTSSEDTHPFKPVLTEIPEENNLINEGPAKRTCETCETASPPKMRRSVETAVEIDHQEAVANLGARNDAVRELIQENLSAEIWRPETTKSITSLFS